MITQKHNHLYIDERSSYTKEEEKHPLAFLNETVLYNFPRHIKKQKNIAHCVSINPDNEIIIKIANQIFKDIKERIPNELRKYVFNAVLGYYSLDNNNDKVQVYNSLKNATAESIKQAFPSISDDDITTSGYFA